MHLQPRLLVPLHPREPIPLRTHVHARTERRPRHRPKGMVLLISPVSGVKINTDDGLDVLHVCGLRSWPSCPQPSSLTPWPSRPRPSGLTPWPSGLVGRADAWPSPAPEAAAVDERPRLPRGRGRPPARTWLPPGQATPCRPSPRAARRGKSPQCPARTSSHPPPQGLRTRGGFPLDSPGSGGLRPPRRRAPPLPGGLRHQTRIRGAGDSEGEALVVAMAAWSMGAASARESASPMGMHGRPASRALRATTTREGRW